MFGFVIPPLGLQDDTRHYVERCAFVGVQKPQTFHLSQNLGRTRDVALLEFRRGEELQGPEQRFVIWRISHFQSCYRSSGEDLRFIEFSRTREALRDVVQNEPGTDVIAFPTISLSNR